MIARIRDYLFGSVFRRGATLLTALTLASYVLGLVRDMVFARVLGAGRLLDVYNAAFIIPDVLLNVFVAGALAAAFVPVFTHLLAKDRGPEAERLAGTMLAGAPGAMAVIGVIAFIAMPLLARLVAPGFAADEMALLVKLSRLMLLSPILFALSNTLGSMLVSLERFAGYGLSPILYNLGIIGGAFLVAPFGPVGLGIGVLAGAVLHLSSRLIALWRSGFHPRGPVDLSNPDFRQVLKLMIPRMAGQPVEQLTFFLFTSLASSLAVGSIAILNFARNFQSLPVSIFGISFATAVFASLSRAGALDDDAGFRRTLKEAAKPLAVVTVLSALFYIVVGKFVIDLFLGGGQFGPEQVAATASLLAVFALSIPAESFIHLLVRAFYALKDTWTPVLVSVPGLGLIWFLAKTFIPLWGLSGLPAAYALSITLEAIVLLVLLRRRLRLAH
ncbi:MAG TPA: murein biosynthesis integral membrane protein MurJ [Candidatus Paceibacterota bacterium]|nr:murein biosynthesis integral membrane protein MurJ [Candidatus Paceibacterota bacterium]